MKIDGRKMNQDQFRNFVETFNFGSIPPTSLVIHHTWRPTQKEWRGQASIEGLKSYYENVKKWPAGPHLFIAEDGIWLFTPMNEVGVHAGKANATWEKFGKTYTGYLGWNEAKYLKTYSIGIEVVGDYDVEQWSGKTKSNALAAIRILMDRLNVPTEEIYFHRDFSKKSCPGDAITKDWLFKQLSKRDAQGSRTSQNLSVLSKWAKDGWEWQLEHDMDRYVHPHEKVTAEWVFAILWKFWKLFIKK